MFAIALIPTVLGKDKPPISTSIMTSVILIVFAATFVTLDLWFSAISTVAAGSPWFILAIQKYFLNKKEKAAQSQ